MKDLLEYLKISTAWHSAFELDYQTTDSQYQDYYLHIDDGDQIYLNFDLNDDCITLYLVDCNGLIIGDNIIFDVKENQKSMIDYLKSMEG